MINFQKFLNADYKAHLSFSFLIRLLVIGYGVYHDSTYAVPFTDVDYKVFSDASRHIIAGNSPYDRYTYRYSPLVALILIPNLLFHPLFGKILFSFIDIVVAVLIKSIVFKSLEDYCKYYGKNNYFEIEETKSDTLSSAISVKQRKKYNKTTNKKHKNEKKVKTELNEVIASKSMLLWLYNPFTIAISARGNCDSISGFVVLLTLYFLQCRKNALVAGLIHGVCIHLRIYPLIYSLTYFMHLSNYSFYFENKSHHKTPHKNPKQNDVTKKAKNHQLIVKNSKERKTIFKLHYLKYLIPNREQLKLVGGCITSLVSLTIIFYYLYGYTFLYETYIFHLFRKDPRHNFSLFFYLQYLTAWVKNIGLWQKALIILPEIILLLVFSVRYGLNKFCLNFSILTQTIVFVIYNTVLTSQYFVWIMAILPLCLWQLKISRKVTLVLITVWFSAQAAWLLPAYLLEFQGHNTFFFIWVQGVSFFCANTAILGRLITHFMSVNSK